MGDGGWGILKPEAGAAGSLAQAKLRGRPQFGADPSSTRNARLLPQNPEYCLSQPGALLQALATEHLLGTIY